MFSIFTFLFTINLIFFTIEYENRNQSNLFPELFRGKKFNTLIYK